MVVLFCFGFFLPGIVMSLYQKTIKRKFCLEKTVKLYSSFTAQFDVKHIYLCAHIPRSPKDFLL